MDLFLDQSPYLYSIKEEKSPQTNFFSQNSTRKYDLDRLEWKIFTGYDGEAMDNHPIPQDVTGFKFRIIGSITVKQFLYLLASGIAVAVLVFFVPMPLYGKIPLLILFGGIGPFFAFIPIEGRPADIMLSNFFKAVFANTLYTYQKQGANLALYPALGINAPHETHSEAKPTTSKADIKRAQLARALRSQAYVPDQGETDQIHRINDFFGDTPPSGNIMNTPSIAKPPVNDVDKNAGSLTPQLKTEEITNATSSRQAEVVPTQEPSSSNITQQPLPATSPEQTPLVAPTPPVVAEEPAQPPQPQAQTSTPASAGSAPQPTPDFPILPDKPNVVLGIIRDPRGKILPGIIVDVKDAQENSLRTFKTDANGKFAAATPMENGIYTISFEDPRGKHTFATMKIELAGNIFQPVSITSVDAREKLRQDLFGKTQTDLA